MGIFENFDQTTWLLFGLLIATVIAYYFWPETTKAQAEVGVDEATRKQAKPLIALASDGADQQLFELSETPLRIRAGRGLKSTKQDAAAVREALWAQQRAMITRLESELDYAQQADISDHFAIAAPANQPATLLEKTLKELEQLHGQVRKLLKVEAQAPMWHGRALILMLSNRKLFDHVAWLTGAGLAASAPGAFTLWEDDIVMITIYATRLGGFARPLTLQVCRAAILSVGGPVTPKWVEYGLAHWMADQVLGRLQLAQNEQPPTWTDTGKAIFEAGTWDKANDDSMKLEFLASQSMLFVAKAMTEGPEHILKPLAGLRAAGEAGTQNLSRWGLELSEKMEIAKASK